jgi:hypothetical protein
VGAKPLGCLFLAKYANATTTSLFFFWRQQMVDIAHHLGRCGMNIPHDILLRKTSNISMLMRNLTVGNVWG